MVKGAGMERSQFWTAKSPVESILWSEMEVGVVNADEFCVKDAVSGFRRSYFEAQRRFPCSKE